jgi:dephospho-CoA kinase
MYIIGLRGNFGTGKTTVGEMLAIHGAVVIDADAVGHGLLAKGSPAYTELIQIFGQEILLPDGGIDRRKLGQLAFKSARSTARLNGVMHPKIRQKLDRIIERQRHTGTRVLVLEAALLVKSHWQGIMHEMWVTSAPQDVVLQRLKARRGYAEEEVLSRLHRQPGPQQMLYQADVVINTDCSLDELSRRVEEEWDRLRTRIRVRGC